MSKRLKLISSILFVCVELGFLVAVLCTSGRVNEILSFASVVLAFAFAILFVPVC